MKIRITQPGWEGYTAELGGIEFVDGVSVDEVSRADAAFLGGIVNIEDADSGKNPSMAQRMIDSNETAMPMSTVPADAAPAPVAAPAEHTLESLEAIADAHGIKGIREIADPLHIKDNSIADLIKKILAHQAEATAKGAAAAEAAK